MKRLKCKLASRRGVTLSEMLVTVAILGLVTLAVSVGISSALRVYNQSVTLSDAQTLTSTLTQAIMDELRYARDIKTNEEGALSSYTSMDYGLNAAFSADNTDYLFHALCIVDGTFILFFFLTSAAGGTGTAFVIAICHSIFRSFW